MKFKIATTSEKINGTGGIAIIGAILKSINFTQKCLSVDHGKRKNMASSVVFLKSYLGLLVQGRTAYSDISMFQTKFFSQALDLEFVPTEDRLRQRLDDVPTTALQCIEEANLELLKRQKFKTVKTEVAEYIPVDIDVSPLDNSRTKKEQVSMTYKMVDGYAPIFSYIGAEGHMLACELRPGSQHCQKGTVEFLERNISFVEKLKINPKCLVRMDSGNDSMDNIRILHNRCHYVIKRNLRKEVPEQWLDLAMKIGEVKTPRPGKKVYHGVKYGVEIPDLENAKTCVAFKVTVRDTDRHGEKFLMPQLDVETYYTDLAGESAEEIIRLYRDHGTSEQFHSELKSDMNVERLPSGKFQTNALILHLSMLAFNMLRHIGKLALANGKVAPVAFTVERLRLKSVIRDLILIACKYVPRSNRHYLKFGTESPWHPMFTCIYEKIAV